MNKSYEYRLVEAHRVVTALHMGGFPGAVVAGGYLRDSRLGLTPKDMDVFIPHCAQRDNAALTGLMQLALGGVVQVQHNISGYANLDVCRIFEVLNVEHDVPVQVIELNRGMSPEQRVRDHDFALCQTWMGIDGSVRTTEGYDRDLQQRTFTLVNAENEAEHSRSLRRWDRLKEKLAPLGFHFIDVTNVSLLGGDCVFCKKPLQMGTNVFTKLGRDETRISGSCETCFDRVTAEPEQDVL